METDEKAITKANNNAISGVFSCSIRLRGLDDVRICAVHCQSNKKTSYMRPLRLCSFIWGHLDLELLV